MFGLSIIRTWKLKKLEEKATLSFERAVRMSKDYGERMFQRGCAVSFAYYTEHGLDQLKVSNHPSGTDRDKMLAEFMVENGFGRML